MLRVCVISGITPRRLLHALHQAHVGPVGAGGPSVPKRGCELAAVGNTDIPLAALCVSAGDVGLAVAVEVADLGVDPADGAPLRPHRGVEASSIGEAGPPGAALLPPRGDVLEAVAVEITDPDIDPSDVRADAPRGPLGGVERR